MNNHEDDGKSTKEQSQKRNMPMVTDFGTRSICNIRFSKVVALPKTALANCGVKDPTKISIKLVQENGDKYIRLEPLSVKKEVAKN